MLASRKVEEMPQAEALGMRVLYSGTSELSS